MRAKDTASAIPLSTELGTILLYGPWKIGKNLRTMPPHDELRALWTGHGAALQASLPRGQRAWFLAREVLVNAVRGEDR